MCSNGLRRLTSARRRSHSCLHPCGTAGNRRPGRAKMATVEFRKLVKRYGTAEVVRGIDLSIRDGEFVVLVGPSGCGKSTTLRMLAGLEDISDGEILIGARKVNEIEPRDRDVAMVFQDYAL